MLRGLVGWRKIGLLGGRRAGVGLEHEAEDRRLWRKCCRDDLPGLELSKADSWFLYLERPSSQTYMDPHCRLPASGISSRSISRSC